MYIYNMMQNFIIYKLFVGILGINLVIVRIFICFKSLITTKITITVLLIFINIFSFHCKFE